MRGLSIKEAAKILKVSTKTLRRQIKAGAIKAKLVSGHKGPEYRILLKTASETAKNGEIAVKVVSAKKGANTDYQKLYEDLLQRHEQAMMLVGKLQSDLQKKMPQLEAHAASLQQKHDELFKLFTEKEHHLKEKDKQIEMKEFIVNELAKELDRANIELLKQRSPWNQFKRWLGFA